MTSNGMIGLVAADDLGSDDHIGFIDPLAIMKGPEKTASAFDEDVGEVSFGEFAKSRFNAQLRIG